MLSLEMLGIMYSTLFMNIYMITYFSFQKTPVACLWTTAKSTCLKPRVEELGLTMLRKSHVIVSGVAGRGKTALAKQLMARMCEEERYLPVKIHDPSEWKNCISCKEKCVVFIDDFIGRSNLNKGELDSWEKLFDEMTSYTKNGKIRIIFGIRNTILQEVGSVLKRHKLFANQYHLHLSQERNDLTHKEKSDMLKYFCQAFDVMIQDKDVIPMKDKAADDKPNTDMITRETLDNIAGTNPLMGFPQACYVFFSDDSMFRLGVDYFVHADQELKDEVRRLRKKEPLRYLLLVYALLENREIDLEQVNKEKLEAICKTLKQSLPDEVDIKDELDCMKQTYLKQTEPGKYEFRHETYMEAVLVSFSDSYPVAFLLNAHDDVIKEFARSSEYQPSDGEICVCLPKAMTQCLIGRIMGMKGVFKTNVIDFGGFKLPAGPTNGGLIIPELPTVEDPNFAKQLVSIITRRKPCRPDIEYLGHCFKTACRYGRKWFVQEVLCNIPVVQGDATGAYGKASDCVFISWTHPDYLPQPNKETQPIPTSTLYITNGDLELGLAYALQYGCTDVSETIFTYAHYDIDRSFGNPTVGSVLQSKMKGMTPVIFASYARCKPSVEYLIQRKVKLNKTDLYGCNALHYCIAAGWVDIVERILSMQRNLIRQESHEKLAPWMLILLLGKRNCAASVKRNYYTKKIALFQ